MAHENDHEQQLDDEEEVDEMEPWTTEGAQRLKAAADALAAAVLAHAEAVSKVTHDQDINDVFTASEALLAVALAYADAQGDYTGSSWPLGVLHEVLDLEDDDEDERDASTPTGIRVLQRRDYAVTDEAALIAAGRAAYLSLSPDEKEADAAADVRDVARAIYQLAHADTWESLGDAPGLQPTAGAVIVIRNEAPMRGQPEQWPDDLFAIDDEVMYRVHDIYFGGPPDDDPYDSDA